MSQGHEIWVKIIPRVSFLCQRCFLVILFPKLGYNVPQFSSKGHKKSFPNSPCRSSKPCVIETNEIELKIIPLVSCMWPKMFTYFFLKLLCNEPQFWTKIPKKEDKLHPIFGNKNCLEHLWSQGGYSRDYFNPIFMALGRLISIFLIWEKNSRNVLDHKEDTLRIILIPLSVL